MSWFNLIEIKGRVAVPRLSPDRLHRGALRS